MLQFELQTEEAKLEKYLWNLAKIEYLGSGTVVKSLSLEFCGSNPVIEKLSFLIL